MRITNNSFDILIALASEDMLACTVVSVTGLAKGSVYTTLDRLHEDGWIKFEERPGPHQRFYMLTAKGRRKLRELRSALDGI